MKIGPLRWLREERIKQIISLAQPHLDKDEDLHCWIRALRPGSRRRGFLFLTPRRCALQWMESSATGGSVRWSEMQYWGVDHDADGGPVVRCEGDGAVLEAQLSTRSETEVRRAREFLARFDRLAPASVRGSENGRFGPPVADRVAPERPGVAAMARRLLVSVLGSLLLLIGFILALPLVPGPGLLLVLAGFALLATEFDWAQDGAEWARRRTQAVMDKVLRRRARR